MGARSGRRSRQRWAWKEDTCDISIFDTISTTISSCFVEQPCRGHGAGVHLAVVRAAA